MSADFYGLIPIAAGTALVVSNKRVSGSFMTLTRVAYGKWFYRGIPLRQIYRVILMVVGAGWILIGLQVLHSPN
jgi:hypothetical protein